MVSLRSRIWRTLKVNEVVHRSLKMIRAPPKKRTVPFILTFRDVRLLRIFSKNVGVHAVCGC